MYNLGLSVRQYTERKGIEYDVVEVYGGEEEILIGRYPETGNFSAPLVIHFPWNTNQQGQTIAENVYRSIENQIYRPVTVKDAVIDPAVEVGDAVQIDGKTFLAIRKDDILDSLFSSDITAPQEDEIKPEFQMLTSAERIRKSVQTVSKAYATLKVDVDNIVAEVTDGQGNYTVLTMDANGVVVKGNSGAVSIKGSQIQAGSLVLTDNITFTNTMNAANAAASDASDAFDLADAIRNGTVTGTFIDGKSIYSPTIYADNFKVYPRNDSTGEGAEGSYELYSRRYTGDYATFKITCYYFQAAPYTKFYSPIGGYADWAFSGTYVRGSVQLADNGRISGFRVGIGDYGTTLPSTQGAKEGNVFFLLGA